MFPLKNHSVSEIEKSLSAALSDLCGKTIHVNISSLVDKGIEDVEPLETIEKAEIVFVASYSKTNY